MYSAFADSPQQKFISISLLDGEKSVNYLLQNDLTNPKKWIDLLKESVRTEIDSLFKSIFLEEDTDKRKVAIDKLNLTSIDFSSLSDLILKLKGENEFESFLTNSIVPALVEKSFSNPELSNYIVFSPEESSLRKFEETTQIYPLGRKGEGLFQYLKEMTLDTKNNKVIKQIKKNLAMLDWYEDFTVPKNLMQNEFSLNIKDRYLEPELKYFDQRSTNEGFLFMLFYFTLFLSENGPKFFAIDNIESSFNPKLCRKLIQILAAMAKEKNKQVIVTTHNPAVLDGLNLEDSDQRLFVVNRDMGGHTKARRIEYKSDRSIRLSEAWQKGLIGGLPDNF
jgi:AAA15 family ATPase/GTPase